MFLSALARPAVHTSVGVEAKIDNWRRALKQAQGIEAFVDGVWLAFPDQYLHNVPRTRPGLKRFGIITVSSEGEAIVVRKPRGHRSVGFARAIAEEHLYARWLDG